MSATVLLRRAAVAIMVLVPVAALTACVNEAGNASGPGGDAPSAFDVVARYPARSLGLRRPTALVVGTNGVLYVTDYSQRLTVISPDGRVVGHWGGPGDGPGEFSFIAGDPSDPTSRTGRLAVGPDGSVYVSDSGNGRIQVFTDNGRFLRQFGHFGSEPDEFLTPYDLAVDDEGVYLVDDDRQTLSKFSTTGTLRWQVGGPSSDEDLLGFSHLVTIDVHHRLVVANETNGRIVYLDTNGHEVDAFTVSGPLLQHLPCDVTVDDLGYTYISPCIAGDTYVFDREHHLVTSWPASEGVLLTAPRFGADGLGYALGKDGSIVVVRPTLGRS
jgi:tripartite motif-containing protein 71